MAGHKAHQLSPARYMAFALWAVDHAEMAQDVDAVKVAMRVTEAQARVLCRALLEARKRPGRKPKDRVVRRFERRLQAQADQGLIPARLSSDAWVARCMAVPGAQGGSTVDAGAEPDVLAYVEASALNAAHSAAACAPRCGTGFATCSHQHLGIGQACEAGQCRVREHDAQVASGVEGIDCGW